MKVAFLPTCTVKFCSGSVKTGVGPPPSPPKPTIILVEAETEVGSGIVCCEKRRSDKRTIPKVFNGIRLVHRPGVPALVLTWGDWGREGAGPADDLIICKSYSCRPDTEKTEEKEASPPVPPVLCRGGVKLFLFQTRCNAGQWRDGVGGSGEVGCLFLRVAEMQRATRQKPCLLLQIRLGFN